MTPAPSLQDLIADVHRDAASDEPLVRLETAARTVRSLTEVGDAALGYFVDQARRAGQSWSEIGEALGVSKQAAQQRQVARTGGLTSVTFERFTDRARAVVAASEDCAREFCHNYVGTEHLLLAQFSMPEGLAAHVLAESGLPAETVRRAIRDRVGEGTQTPEGHLPFTPRAIEVFTGALAAALELGHNYIGTEHLLVGTVRTDGLAHDILTAAGLDEAVLTPKIVAKLAGFQPSARARARAPRKRPTKKARKR
jgi:Clp amino terminal domain, pathogenicity island component